MKGTGTVIDNIFHFATCFRPAALHVNYVSTAGRCAVKKKAFVSKYKNHISVFVICIMYFRKVRTFALVNAFV